MNAEIAVLENETTLDIAKGAVDHRGLVLEQSCVVDELSHTLCTRAHKIRGVAKSQAPRDLEQGCPNIVLFGAESTDESTFRFQ